MNKHKCLPQYRPVEGYKHVGLDDKGVPYIQGTTMKVLELASENVEYKWDSEQLQIQHPYLDRGQIHSALAYYYDHRDEVDRDIERRRQFVEEMREAAGPSPLAARLKSEGLV